MNARPIIRGAIAAAALFALGAPLRAHAGGVTITAHKIVLPIKAVSQDQSGSGNDTRHTESVSSQDLFEICSGGDRPTNTQAVFLFLDCSNLNNNTLELVQTASNNTSFTRIRVIGSIAFDTPVVSTSSNKGATLTSQRMPATVTLTCPLLTGNALAAEITGVANVNFSKLNTLQCPSTVKFQGTGSGSATTSTGFSGDFIVDQGSVINGQNRSTSLTVFP